MFKDKPMVQAALMKRNETLANFWLSDPCLRNRIEPTLLGRAALVIDAEDAFTEMLAQQLSAIGLLVTIRKWSDLKLCEGNWDLITMGPGPGDPRDMSDKRVLAIRDALIYFLTTRQPFLAVCLSHQILCLELGLNIIRKASPNQGVQREINYFGEKELVGFYNTYVALCQHNSIQYINNETIEVCRDAQANDVHSLRGSSFASVQFHPESILTNQGIKIISSALKRIMNV